MAPWRNGRRRGLKRPAGVFVAENVLEVPRKRRAARSFWRVFQAVFQPQREGFAIPRERIPEQTATSAGILAYLKGTMKTLVRELPGGLPGRTIEIPADIPCVTVNPGNDLLCLVEQGGRLYEPHGDLWRVPVTSLGACKVGTKVFANCSNWVNSPIHWTRYEIMAKAY